MVDKASFVVALKNKISGPGRAAARSIQGVGKGLRSIGRVSDGLDNMVDRLDRVAQKRGVLVNFRKQLRANALQAKSGTSLFSVFARTLGQNLQGAATLGRRGLKRLSTGVDSLSSKLLGAAKSSGILLGAATGLAAFLVTKGVVGAAEFSESARLALTSLTGSAQQGEAAFQKSIKLAGDLGLKVQNTTKQVIKLRAAQFTIGESLELVKLGSDLRAIGSSAQEVNSVLRAITQIKSKGTLALEELTGQLSEANISAELVFEKLEKNLGKTRKQVLAAITGRQVDAATGIQAIREAILSKANIKEAGDAGRAFADSTIGGLLGRLAAAPQLLFLAASEASSEVSPKFKAVVKDLTRFIEDISPRGLADVATNVLEIVRKGIPLVKEFAEGFGEGFSGIIDALGGGSGDPEKLAKGFRDLGRDMAEIIVVGVKLSKVLVKAMAALLSPTGRATVKVALLSLGFLKLTNVVGKVAILFGAGAQAGTLGAGFTVFGKGLKPVITQVARLPAAFGILLTSAKAVGVTLGTILTSSLALPAAFAAVGVGIGALGFIFREEIAKFQLNLFDEFFSIGEGLPDALGRGIRAGIGSGLFGPLGGVAVGVADFLRDDTGNAAPAGAAARQTPAELRADRAERAASRVAAANAVVNPQFSGARGGPRIAAPISVTVSVGENAKPGEVGTEVARGVQKGIRSAFTTAPQGA